MPTSASNEYLTTLGTRAFGDENEAMHAHGASSLSQTWFLMQLILEKSIRINLEPTERQNRNAILYFPFRQRKMFLFFINKMW